MTRAASTKQPDKGWRSSGQAAIGVPKCYECEGPSENLTDGVRHRILRAGGEQEQKLKRSEEGGAVHLLKKAPRCRLTRCEFFCPSVFSPNRCLYKFRNNQSAAAACFAGVYGENSA